jgi:hypothetical protein
MLDAYHTEHNIFVQYILWSMGFLKRARIMVLKDNIGFVMDNFKIELHSDNRADAKTQRSCLFY